MDINEIKTVTTGYEVLGKVFDYREDAEMYVRFSLVEEDVNEIRKLGVSIYAKVVYAHSAKTEYDYKEGYYMAVCDVYEDAKNIVGYSFGSYDVALFEDGYNPRHKEYIRLYHMGETK